jgi:NADPH2:quinone reductase
MKAVVVRRFRSPRGPRYRRARRPRPESDEAFVEVGVSGVNFLDVYYRKGIFRLALRFIPGSERNLSAEELFHRGRSSSLARD